VNDFWVKFIPFVMRLHNLKTMIFSFSRDMYTLSLELQAI